MNRRMFFAALAGGAMVPLVPKVNSLTRVQVRTMYGMMYFQHTRPYSNIEKLQAEYLESVLKPWVAKWHGKIGEPLAIRFRKVEA